MDADENTVRVSVDVPETLRQKLKFAALAERTTLREYVLTALRERLRADEERGSDGRGNG